MFSKNSVWSIIFTFNIDGFVKSFFPLICVIPEKAGIHPAAPGTAFAGMTVFLTFYKIIKIEVALKKTFLTLNIQGCKTNLAEACFPP